MTRLALKLQMRDRIVSFRLNKIYTKALYTEYVIMENINFNKIEVQTMTVLPSKVFALGIIKHFSLNKTVGIVRITK